MSYDHKNHTRGTLGVNLNICPWNLKKNKFLLIFDDFRKIRHQNRQPPKISTFWA